MPNIALQIGPVYNLTANQVYAIPPVIQQWSVEPENSVIEGSVDGTNWTVVAFASTDNGIISQFPFPFARTTQSGVSIRQVKL